MRPWSRSKGTDRPVSRVVVSFLTLPGTSSLQYVNEWSTTMALATKHHRWGSGSKIWIILKKRNMCRHPTTVIVSHAVQRSMRSSRVIELDGTPRFFLHWTNIWLVSAGVEAIHEGSVVEMVNFFSIFIRKIGGARRWKHFWRGIFQSGWPICQARLCLVSNILETWTCCNVSIRNEWHESPYYFLTRDRVLISENAMDEQQVVLRRKVWWKCNG